MTYKCKICNKEYKITCRCGSIGCVNPEDYLFCSSDCAASYLPKLEEVRDFLYDLKDADAKLLHRLDDITEDDILLEYMKEYMVFAC